MQRIKSKDALSPHRKLWHAQDLPRGSKLSQRKLFWPLFNSQIYLYFQLPIFTVSSCNTQNHNKSFRCDQCSEQQQTAKLQTTVQVLFDIPTDWSQKGVSFTLATCLTLPERLTDTTLPTAPPRPCPGCSSTVDSARTPSVQRLHDAAPHIKTVCSPQ